MEAHKWTAIIPVGTLRGGLVTTGQNLHQSKDHRLEIAPELLPLLITVIVRHRQEGAHQPRAVFFSKSNERRPSTPQRRSKARLECRDFRTWRNGGRGCGEGSLSQQRENRDSIQSQVFLVALPIASPADWA
jgi:hypothetical protein